MCCNSVCVLGEGGGVGVGDVRERVLRVDGWKREYYW